MNQKELRNEALLVESKIKNSTLHEKPFKHIQIDNFLSEKLIEECLKKLPWKIILKIGKKQTMMK